MSERSVHDNNVYGSACRNAPVAMTPSRVAIAVYFGDPEAESKCF